MSNTGASPGHPPIEAELRAVLDRVSDGFVALDAWWRLIYLNQTAADLMPRIGKSNRQVLGCSLWEEFPELLGTPLERECRRVVEEQIPVEFDFFSSPLNEWFLLRCIPSSDGLLIHFLNITVRKRAEQHQAIEHAVSAVMADGLPLAETCQCILQAVCETLGWEFGALWRAEDQGGELRCAETWRRSDSVSAFEEVSRRITFIQGVGLPGRVWASGQAAWIPDVTRDSNFPRAPAAVFAGLHGAFGFPIRSNRQMIGVMEFFSGSIQEPDDGLLALMATIGSQIGQIILRKQAQDAVRKSEALKSAMLAASLDALIVIDQTDEVIEFSPAAERIFGFRRSDVIGKRLVDLIIPPAYREKHLEGMQRFLATGEAPVLGKRLELTAIRADGAEFPSELTITRLPVEPGGEGQTDERAMFIGYVRDITKRRTAEQAARFQAHLLDTVEQAVIATDLVGRITYWNRYAERLYGWTSGEVKGTNILEVTPGPGGLEQAAEIMEQVQLGESWAGEFEVRRRDGSLFPAWVVDAPIFDENGKVVGVVGVSTDISELKRLEGSLRERMEELQTADRRKDEFLAMLAHELRNPLGAVSNAIAVLLQIGTPGDRAERLRGIIQRQVGHLSRIVEDLLEASRLARGLVDLQKQQIDLQRVVTHAIEICRGLVDARDQNLTVSFPSQPVELEADPTRLTQVVCNLLDNSIKYTSIGGSISVSVRVEEMRDSPIAVLRVMDNGAGISSELLPHVFDLFTQAERSLARSSGGLGLGLAVVKRIVQMHGGVIQAASEGAGKGSTFEVRLPVAPPAHRTGPVEEPEPTAIRIGARKVLVIEDSVDAAESLTALLELWGHDVQIAHTGEVGLAMAREFLPDVVLLDIGLPGMDGYETARLLREETPARGMRIVAITGFDNETDRQLSGAQGIDLHLTKPVDPELLLEAMGGTPHGNPRG